MIGSRLRYAVAGVALAALAAAPLTNDLLFHDHRQHLHKVDFTSSVAAPAERVGPAACVDGTAADTWDCQGIDLLQFIPDDEMFTDNTDALAGGGISDIWGWTSPDTGNEYIFFGKTNGTAFYDVTDPEDPTYLGEVPNTGAQLVWHDIKVYDNYAFIVSESPGHGVKVFDLTKLDLLAGAPATAPVHPTELAFDAVYPVDGAAHNIVINPDDATAYIVGSGQVLGMGGACATEGGVGDAGLHAIDISTPLAPLYEGCYAEDSYIHDAHCVTYHGPDAEHDGRQICLTSNEDTISAVDVTDMANPTKLSTLHYPNDVYSHQGWLSEDHAFYFHGDELDESDDPRIQNTRTIIADVRDLDDLKLHHEKDHDTRVIDHNMYTKNGLLYQSNYEAGLRVLDTAPVAEHFELPEIAFFDTYPDSDKATFNGTWSNYIYFDSGTIAVTGIGEGIFLLEVQDEVLNQYEFDPLTETPDRALPDG